MKELKDNYWDTGKNYSDGGKKFCFFETNDQKYAIIYNDIEEYSIMKFASSIEIWMHKQNPKLIFRTDQRIFAFVFNRSCYYLEKSDLLVMLTVCIPGYQTSYMVMNANSARFIKIENKAKFEELNGMLISLENLSWLPLNDATHYCQIPMSNLNVN